MNFVTYLHFVIYNEKVKFYILLLSEQEEQKKNDDGDSYSAYNKYLLDYMYHNSAKMRSSDYVCDVLSYLTQKQTYKIDCEIHRTLISDNQVVRTRYNVTLSTYKQPSHVFENITLVYQDLSNPDVLIARTQKVTNKTITYKTGTRSLSQNLVMLSDLDFSSLSLVKINSVQQTDSSRKLHSLEKTSFYTWPLNMSTSTSEIKSSSFTVRKNFSASIQLSPKARFLPTNTRKKIEKKQHFSYLIDPIRFKLKIEVKKNRRKKNRKLIHKLTKLFEKYSTGSCQRLDVLKKMNGFCVRDECRLRIRIKFTVSYC